MPDAQKFERLTRLDNTLPHGLVFDGGSLRPWHASDAPELVEAWADIEISRWNTVPTDATRATAERWIQGQERRLEQRLSIDLVIVADGGIGDGAVVGEVGLSGFSDTHHGALVGYWLVPAARGQGLATRAVVTFCDWAHRALALDVIVARCHQSNTASQAVASNAGFVYEANEPSGNQLWTSRTRDA